MQWRSICLCVFSPDIPMPLLRSPLPAALGVLIIFAVGDSVVVW